MSLKPTHHLQQSQIACSNIVKIDFDILPSSAVIHQAQAFGHIVDNTAGEDLVCGGVDTVKVLPGKQVDPHDAENEPEDEADQ